MLICLVDYHCVLEHFELRDLYLDSLPQLFSSLDNPGPEVEVAIRTHFLNLNNALEAKAKEMEYINDQSRLKERILKDKIERRLQAGLEGISTPARTVTSSSPVTFGLPTPSGSSGQGSVANASVANARTPASSWRVLRNLQPRPTVLVQSGTPPDPSNFNFTPPTSGFNVLEPDFSFSGSEFEVGTPGIADFTWGSLDEVVSTPGRLWDEMGGVGDRMQEDSDEAARK